MDPLAALRSWKAEPFTLISLSLACFVYYRGWKSLQRSAARRFSSIRLFCFLAGQVILYLALASPLDAFAGFLLQVHMVQHLLLTMLVPPILLFGAPYLPILRGLPHVWVRDVIGPFLRSGLWKIIAGFFAHPVVSFLLFTGSNVIWHLPPFYNVTLRSDAWHLAEHLCFLFTSLLFWWHIVLPWPAHPKYSRWFIIPYLLLADLQNTGLGAFLTFYDHPLYPAYEAVPRLWNIGVMADQASAGAIMWVPGSLAFLIPLPFIVVRLLTPARPRQAQPTAAFGVTTQLVASQRRKPSWFIRLARTPLRRTLQIGMLLLSAAVIWDGFFGPRAASMNLAGVLPWTYWRGLSVIALLTMGNLFCSICPFVLARDAARKVLPWSPTRLWPRALRNKWSAIALLAVFLWAYEVFDIWNRPAWTAVLILGYFVTAIGIDTLFRGASFCKYVCPIGQYHFAFSGNSSTEIAVQNPGICASCRTHDCLRGNEHDRGCELHLFQPKKSGNTDCTYCLDCVRACPHDNVDLLAVVPAHDLASNRFRSAIGRYAQRPDLAALFGLFIVGALINAAGMTAPIVAFTGSLVERTHFPEQIVTSVLFLGALAVALGVDILTALLSKFSVVSPQSLWGLLIAFAPAFVPLGASIWAFHFLFHFATGAFTIWPVLQRFLGDLGLHFLGAPDWNWIGFSGNWIMELELTIVDAGFLGTLYLAWKIACREFPDRPSGRAFVPWAVLISLLFAATIWTMFQPMDMRGTMLSSH